MKVIYKQSFYKDIKNIKEKWVKEKLGLLIEKLKTTNSLTEMTNLKPILGNQKGFYRIRVGDYRLGLKLENDEIILIHFMHRREIYRHFP